VKDARAALDALREEHHEKLRHQAEEAERIRQLHMAHKLEIMCKKKQEYLQYQRQLALQNIQEQEGEMQMRQEQQKQQYLMGSSIPYNMQPPYMSGHGPGFGPASMDGSPVHGSQYTTVPGPNSFTSLPPATTSAVLPTYRDYSGLYSVPNMQGLPGQGQIPGGPLPQMPQGPIQAGIPPDVIHGLPRGTIPNPMMPMPEQMRILKLVPTTHHTSRKVFVHLALRDSKFVFIRHDATRTPLQPVYDGPYQVLSRTDKHLELATPTGKQTVSIDWVKRAFLLTDTPDPIASPAPLTSAQQTAGMEPIQYATTLRHLRLNNSIGQTSNLPQALFGRHWGGSVWWPLSY
jgi:hypothetical protein